ncbi:MAG: Zn-ribbon OB-fold protein [Acidimicrobiales bacterium]|jgi:uncharacterized OB-fold protein|nr:Zn-ribbon OB-fold protein [Acidimicrobiales bacterium]
MTDLPVVVPDVTADVLPFWDGAATDRLVIPRCRDCATFVWYPRAMCPECHSVDVAWVEVSGGGTIYSFTISHRAAGAWADHVPYVIAYVELDEGPRVLTNIVGADLDALRIGDPVTPVFHAAGATKVLRFTPASRAGGG